MKKIGLILGIVFILVIGWFTQGVFDINDKPPQFFPFNQKNARYEVVESGGKNSIISIDYTGPGIYDSSKTIRVIVGNSPVNLWNLVGKKIFITKGDFVGSFKQCIQDYPCVDLYGNNAVVNIEEMNVVQ